MTALFLNRVDLVVRNYATVRSFFLVSLLMLAQLRKKVCIDDIFVGALGVAKVLVGAAHW